MSVSSGRMSRADAHAILEALQPAIREFTGPDAPGEILAEAAFCEAHRAEYQTLLDSGHMSPDAHGIRALRTRVAALQWDRMQHSMDTPPRMTAAVVVTLYGLTAGDTTRAAMLAAEQLGLDAPEEVRLQDSSHVRTPTLTGTRYIFTTHTP